VSDAIKQASKEIGGVVAVAIPLMDFLGVYVQVPFCASKCTFCNFSSKVAPDSVFDNYSAALADEIGSLSSSYLGQGIGKDLDNLPVDTLYLGGGTPSLLGAERLERICRALRGRFQFTACPEFTIEITPGSADPSFLSKLRVLGINRLSIGAQSFVDQELSTVGRLHSSADTIDQVRAARQAGFTNLNLDLIAGLPHQTESSWRASIRAALELKPEHISIYVFEVDSQSRLGGEVLGHGNNYHAAYVPGDDFMADAYQSARQLLAHESYIQYEISNYSLPGHESRHNRKYWQLKPYIGLGAGAHSFDGVRRWSNETVVEMYEERIGRGESPIAETHALSTQEQLEEFFFLGLRQSDGVDLARARLQWGQTELFRWEPKLAALAREGRIERREDHVALRQSAYLVSNEIFQEFLTA
jgi:oxygen-independent coproporphyrinogen-3 oxidase